MTMTSEALRSNLIYELVRRTRERGHDIGRTKIQKLVYFLQDLEPIPEYRYQLRHYGPYSQELSQEVDTLASLGFIRMEPDPTGYGFHIFPGQRTPEPSTDLRKYEGAIDHVLMSFAPSELGQLEIMATIKFVGNLLSNKGRRPQQEEILSVVGELKPHYHRDFIRTCYDVLQRFPQPR